MNNLTDHQLLRDYAERRSEAAFAELVRRHVDLVYSAALRIVCDAHLAEDVTQEVFLALARNAGQLTRHPVLAGWLHRTTQNLAANTVRSYVRRRAREQKAAAMNELISAEPDAVWEQIAPHLDTALGELNELDRDAVLLRYFQNKSAREMAQILDTTEDAAQKRVSRAVDRLRESFSSHGVAVGAGGLVVAVSANAVQAAPAGLAAAISSAAVLAGTTIAATTTATITKAIAMITMQKALVALTITAAVGAGVYEAHQASTLRNRVRALEQQQAPVAEQSQQSSRDGNEAAGNSTRENAQLKMALTASQTEVEKLTAALEKERRERERLAAFSDYQSMFGAAAINALTGGVTNMPASLEEALTQASLVLKDADALRRKYSQGRPADGPEREEFDAAMKKLMERVTTLMSDKHLEEAMSSGDPEIPARCQLWLLAGALDMNANQIQQVDQLLQQNYRVWFAQKLNTASRPDTGVEEWNKARAEFSANTYRQINVTLDPEQQKSFDRIFGTEFMTRMTLRFPGQSSH